MQTQRWTRLTAVLVCFGLLACSSPKEAESPPTQVPPPTAAAASEAPAVALEEPRDGLRVDFFDSAGLAREENGKNCFISYSRTLSPGMPILLVDPGSAFQVARLGPKLAEPCMPYQSLYFDVTLATLPTFYEVELLEPDKGMPGFWIGIPGASPGALSMNADHQPEGDLDNDGTPERFFYCNSMEGYHYAIRSIGGEKGRQRWLAYVSAGYEMEGSTCPPEATEPVAPHPAGGTTP